MTLGEDDSPLADGAIAFVDVETTGGHPVWHRIAEIAIVAMRAGEIEWEWRSLVNPGTRIPPSIERLTGITQDMVQDAPRFEDLADEIAARLAQRRFVAHNVRFDYGFVRAEMRRAGRKFSAPLTCTVRLSRDLYHDTGRHNLDSIIERLGLTCGSRHRALPDAQVLAQLWQRLRAGWPTATLDAAIQRVSRRPLLPSHLSPDLIDDLPESAGVYRFFGEGGALIYVGKANNLRERVLGHFMGASRDAKSQRLTSQLRRIEWTETAGELGALLLESRLVRELEPVYNRRLRGGDAYTWLVDDTGLAPQLHQLDGPIPLGVDAFGIYRSARQAKTALVNIARDHKCCLRVLGLEAGDTGSCFAYQVGRCAGACVGKEPLARHSARLKLHLAALKLRLWPYQGPVAVEEISALGIRHWHVIDGWQYLGTVVADEFDQSNELTPRLHPATDGFDADAYRILCRHLKPGARNFRPWPSSI
ncbi:MAG: ethanolamine utilization protein [Gammaproteobacteria bacterium]|nr:ethanolamine utilization protein [Gammaproteobacteria bacterium]